MATYADYLATGQGRVAYRLVIEGCPDIFVTDETMRCTMADGRRVVAGLLAESLSIEERAFIAGAELDLKLSSIQIMETPGADLDAATAAFTGFSAASTLTWLDDDSGTVLSAAATTTTVRASGPLSVGQRVHIGTETWTIGSITPSGTTARSTITMTRGEWRTTAQAYYNVIPDSTRLSTNLLELTDQPANYAGRRCWLYGHGTSELALDTSDDRETVADVSVCTLLWRGVISGNPELSDSRTWSLPVQSRLALFDSDVGKAASGGTKIRGIYYSAECPLAIGFGLRSGAARDSTYGDAYQFYFYGFWETQEAFCQALTDALAADAALALWAITLIARPTADGAFGTGTGGWDLFYTPNAGTPKWLDVEGGSPVDGGFTGELIYQFPTRWVPMSTVAGLGEFRCGWVRNEVPWYGAQSSVPLASVRGVPRACYSPWIGGLSDALHTLWPRKRFYLDFAGSLGSWGTVKITLPDPVDGSATPEPVSAAVGLYSSGGYIEITDTSIDVPSFGAAGSYGPSFELTSAFGPITSLTGCNLAEFMQALVDAGPTIANIGGPFITSDDVADWSAEVAAATTGISSLQRRIYSFTKPKKLIDIIREECKLHGLYLRLDSSGKISVRRMPSATSAAPAYTIDATSHTPGDDFGTMKLSPDGLVTTVVVKGGYDAAEDKWSSEWNFRSLVGMSRVKSKGQTVTVAPFARAYAPSSDGGDVSIVDADRLVGGMLSLFGAQYYYVDVPVSITLHGARIGDEVLVTVKQLPYAGARAQNTPGAGMTLVRGFVIGRKWDYGSSPSGVLTVLLSARNTAGYAPSAEVISATGGPTSWALTTTATWFSTGTDASYFAAGYRIILREFDADAPRAYTGVISSVAGSVITVALETGWAGMGAAQWRLSFDGAANGIATGQKAFVYMADVTGRITYAEGSTSPRVFS